MALKPFALILCLHAAVHQVANVFMMNRPDYKDVPLGA
jgi:hypothetical protein